MRRSSAALATVALATIAAGAGIATAALAESTPAGQGSLSVTVTGLHSGKGKLVACLWRDSQGFPSCEKSRGATRLVVPVTATTMALSFAGVAPGSYAVTVHHDEDGNGRMKRNLIGMPAEGVGVSNNPGGMPGFAKSLVRVAGDGAITVRMRYLFD